MRKMRKMRNIVSRCLDVVMFILDILMCIGLIVLTILAAALAYYAIVEGVWPLAFPIVGFIALMWYLFLDAIQEGR